MSKEELKTALSGLNVSRPLKIAATAPVFQAPEPVGTAGTQVQSEPGFTTIPESKTPPVQNEPRIERSSGPRAATPQDDAVLLQRELHDKLATGYTRLPNALLMNMLVGDLGKNEVRLLLLIARLTLSFDREFVKLSKGVVKRYTGMQGRAMLDAFGVLEERKLIRKVTGDHKSPNQYALTAEVTTAGPSPGSKRTQVQNPPQVQNSTQGWVQNEPPRKDNLEIYKNSLSQQPDSVRDYFAAPMTARKRESEWLAYQGLVSQFALADVARALEHVRRHGLPGSKEPCHSPMAFLSMGMGQVLAALNGARVGAERVRLEAVERERSVQQEVCEFQADAAQAREREAAFTAAFPTAAEQTALMAKYAAENRLLTPSGPIARRLAIADWWERTQSMRVVS